MKPPGELLPDRRHETLERLEVGIVRAEAARQLPDAFHGIQSGAVRRQEVQTQHVAMRAQPGLQRPRVMPARVVHDDQQLAPTSTPAKQVGQKRPKALGVERLGWHREQPSVGRTDGTEDSSVFARRRVQQHGIDLLGRNPHGAAGSVLLEVTFVFEPQVNHLVGGEMAQFFYMRAGRGDQRARLRGAACAVGSRTGGRGVGIGARAGVHHIARPGDG